ncbi:MAG: transcriptional regulator, MarR family [Labilithrix sp.]|nr:transcriptional regulator, MarR family [Labilithrix sp.]
MADQDRFARALLALARGLGRVARERARAGDVTPQQAETLQLIAEKGAVSTSTLATLLGIDPSTASRNLSGLERAGLIARQKGSDDGRQTDVRLTPRGRRAAQSVGSGAASAFGSLLDKVPRADRAKVIDALEVIVKAVEASSATPSR